MKAEGWIGIATYQTGLDADIAAARLEAEDIPAVRDSHDSVGIIGFGFQGATNAGFTLLVPEAEYERAPQALRVE